MNRDQLRERIDTMERLHDVMGAIDELSEAELNALDCIDLTLSERNLDKAPICFARNLPPALVIVGLRAMVGELESQLAASDDLQRATSLRRKASHG